MLANFVKCSSAQCEGRAFYPNQLTRIAVGEETVTLCPSCNKSLMASISNRDFLDDMARSTMTMGEVVRMRKERAQMYVESQMEKLLCWAENKELVEAS